MDAEHAIPEALLAERGWLRRFAAGLVGDAAADDLVQEAWVAAAQRPPHTNPRGWLRTVVRNLARQRHRSESRRRGREERAAREEGLPSSEELAERMELQRVVAEAVGRLDEPYRATVILRYLEDLTPAEIARHLELPDGTVRRRLHEAHARLRRDLDGKLGGRAAWMPTLALLTRPEGGAPTFPLPGGSAVVGGALTVKKLTVALAAIAAAIAIVAVVRDDVPRTTSAPLAGSVPVAALPAAEVERAVEVPPAAPADVVPSTARREEVASDQVWVSGTVDVPRGCTSDDALEVFVLDEATSYPRFLAALRDRKEDEIVVARGPVEAGSFRVAVSPGLEAAHLMLRGRRLFLDQSVASVPGGEPARLAPRAGAWIRGSLRGPSGEGEGDVVLVGVATGGGLDPASALTGDFHSFPARSEEDGAFELRAVPPELELRLYAVPGRLAATVIDVPGVPACAEHDLELGLAAGSRVEGRVLSEHGDPVGGAQVTCFMPGRWFGFDDVPVRFTESAADGTYALDGVPSSVVVQASLTGRLESPRRAVRIAERESVDGVDLVVSTGAALRGEVRWPSGLPAADVLVRAEFDTVFLAGDESTNFLRGARGEARTGEDGRFSILGLGGGPFLVTCEAERAVEEGEVASHTARLDGLRDLGEPVLLHLLPPSDLAVRVVDPRGNAIPGASVSARRVVAGPLGEVAMGPVEEGEAGAERHLLEELIAGRWDLVARAPGHVEKAQRITLPADAAREHLVELLPAASVAGTVVGPDGLPHAGATVRLDRGRPSWMEGVAAGAPAPQTRSDADGAFVLDGLPAGRVALAAEAPGLSGGTALELEVVPGRPVEGVVLSLAAGGTVTGEVVASSGEPAAARIVYLDHPASGDQRFTTTDEAGTFRLQGLGVGTWNVAALQQGADESQPFAGEVEFTTVEVADGETVHVRLGARAVGAVQVEGRVLSGGEPHARAWIFFSPESPTGRDDPMHMATCDKDGRFSARLERPGGWMVSVQRAPEVPGDENTVDFLRTIPAVESFRLDLELPAGRLGGRVLGPDGEPAVGARVTVFSEGGDGEEYDAGTYVEAKTGEDGRFVLRNLRPGEYTVFAGGAATAEGDAVFARAVHEPVELRAGEERLDVDLQLPDAGSVEVRVFGPGGEPVGGAAIFVRHAESGTVMDPVSFTATAGDGGALCDWVPPGEWLFSARTAAAASAADVAVRVHPAETATVDLHLVAGTFLRVELQDDRGRPVRGRVQVLDTDEREVGGMFGAGELERLFFTGAFSPSSPGFGPLPPGRYRVVGTAHDGGEGEVGVTLDGQPEERVVVRLER